MSTDLIAFKEQTALMRTQAMDTVNCETVKRGYQLSGKPSSTAFTNVQAMAISRMKKHYPLCNDLKDPLYARIFTHVLQICADVIRLKYECRENRVPFEHLKECDRRVDEFFKNEFPIVSQEYNQLMLGGCI